MRYAIILTVLALLFCAACQTTSIRPVPSAAVPVIPAPADVQALRGSFTVTSRTAIFVPHDAKVEWTARYFADLLARTRGLSLPLVHAPASGAISFALDAGQSVPSDEGYQ